MKTTFTIVGASAALVGVLLISPILYFVFGAFFGWVLWQVFPWAGQWLIDGMSLFHIELSPSNLPLLTATLAFIGSHFKSTHTTKK